ncbi:MAG: phosphate ABC transporter substrate-binding protein PstS [Synergistetes bacterium]|nr:MAG: Phosphate-binding protein [bacterium 42_11]MBC7331251.1 phosphate ABC transporter substrate-binding protein PstS [Synergistota bacterium]MDK2871551.1 phosphate transport system substrate-binding protein [bacterium]
MKILRVFLAFLLLVIPVSEAKGVELIGAGATFPYPLYSKLFSVYHNETGVKVNYQAIGSGGGIRQLINKTVDFGATDSPLTERELEDAGAPVLHIPTCLGALVLAYNLPGVNELKLTGKVIADIYLGKIKKWNDPEIAKLNPDIKLPKMNITVVYRSDGSGSTYIFSQYLSKVSEEWKEKVGVGKSLKWPTGIGGKGNPGVAGLIKQIPGSIGYIEFVYATQSEIPFALIENKSGNFVKPSVETVTAAANMEIPESTIVDLTETSSPEGYPLSSFTWIIVYKEQNYGGRPLQKAEELVKLLWWIIHDGQKYASELSYSPLPQIAVEKAEKLIKSITYNGEPILK